MLAVEMMLHGGAKINSAKRHGASTFHECKQQKCECGRSERVSAILTESTITGQAKIPTP